jgi:hypothetical protein
MKEIEVGHIIRVFDKNDTFEGVVVGIENHMDNSFLKYININVYDALSKKACKLCSSKTEYSENDEFSIIFVRDISYDKKHIAKLQKLFKDFHETPETIEPNKTYGNGVQVYVKTKKNWFNLLKTTAKMAQFEGGSCRISSISCIRRQS